MTVEIALVLGILLIAIVLFVTERFRVDVVALLVLSALIVTGLVGPVEALSGFSNSAVVTVWAIFILSGGLAQTGVANIMGRQVLRLAGSGYVRLLLILMVTAGVLSGFMNNIGVIAMLLPVIVGISRETGYSPSKLLLPTVYAALLGGMLTLIGTPTNILISGALVAAGYEPLGIFSFTPLGMAVLGAGIVFVLVVGKRFLPDYSPVRDLAQADAGERHGKRSQYGLEERLAVITIPEVTTLEGVTLAESRIGAALGLNILGLSRGKKREMVPDPATRLQGGDELLVLGRLDRLELLAQRPGLAPATRTELLTDLLSGDAALAEFALSADSSFIGRTPIQAGVRQQFGVNILAILRHGELYTRNLPQMVAEVGDRVLLFGSRARLADYLDNPAFRLLDEGEAAVFNIDSSLLAVDVFADSLLASRTLQESQLANTFGLNALCVVRQSGNIIMPGPDTELAPGDTLIVTGDTRDLEIVRGLQDLQFDRRPDIDPDSLESEAVGLSEAMLSPYTTLANKTLRELRFREKYELSVLAIWSNGRPFRTDLGNLPLKLGDVLLLYGSREKLKILAREPGFLVLDSDVQKEPNYAKAPLSALLMLAVVFTVLLGWLPIAPAAVIGATLMVVTGCLSMDDAYRYIDWKAVFLIAAMLPLGFAMEQTGAASLLADQMLNLVGGYGPYAIMAGIFLLALAATQFMPNPVVAVLFAPIALTAADAAGVAPFAFMMALVVAASSSFLSPVGHAANVLVMGPGSYTFGDYPRAGLPVALVIFIVTMLVVPLIWPF